MREGSMNIDYLVEFAYLAESLSFKRTADHFYASRSVISRHMSALEEVVGAKLLDRDSRTVELTEAGNVFYREAKTVLRDWDIALERTRDAAAGMATLVRIGYLRNAARPVLVDFARHMADEHPDVRLSLICMKYGELKRALGEHAVDVALAVNVSPELSRNYRSTLVYKDRYFVVCAPNHPFATLGRALTPDDLRGQKLLLPESYVGSGFAKKLDGLVDEKVHHEAREFYEDIDMLNLKVQTEGYIAFSSSMNDTLFGDRLAMLPVAEVDTSFSVSSFYHDEFTGPAFLACREGFEWCRANLSM